MKERWFHIALIFLIALPIITLVFLDYYNLEGYNYRYNVETDSFEFWPNGFINSSFVFELTWKGRMFLLVFLWIALVESALDWKKLVDGKPRNRYIMFGSLICALVPMIYVIAVNFFGLDLLILKIGHETFGVRSVTSTNEPWDLLQLHWPISCEYVVFTVFFIGAVLMAYGTKGLKALSISFSLIGGMGAAYMFDTIYPFGIFKPLQAFALPTAAVAAALFDLLGYNVQLVFPVYTLDSYLPSLTIFAGEKHASVTIGWACAGVQSLMLYLLIIFVFFKKADITPFRKLAYFIIGLFGTFFVNVLRVFSILIIILNHGKDAGTAFHNTYGEVYSSIWILLFILLIGCIERFMLVEWTKHAFNRLFSIGKNVQSRLSARINALKDKRQTE